MKSADLVLYIFDVNTTTNEELQTTLAGFQKQGVKYLLAGNKSDQANAAALKEKFNTHREIHFISARNNTGMDELKTALFSTIVNNKFQTDNTIVTNARHHAALQEVQRSLLDIRNGLDNKVPGDLLALDIRRCLHYISEITGDISNEDVLDYIFSKFCIGK